MKYLSIILVLFTSSLSLAQEPINKNKTVFNFWGEKSKKVYKAPNFKEELAMHKKVAILPFKASLLYICKKINNEIGL